MGIMRRLFGRFCSRHSCHGGSRLERRIRRKLELDAGQRAKLAAVAQQLRNARNSFANDRDDNWMELVTLFFAERLDRDRSRDLLKHQLLKIESEGQALLASFADFFDALAPQQRERLRLYVEKRSGCCHC